MSFKKLFSSLFVVILWFICVLALARTGFTFAAARVHGLDVIVSHLTSLSGVERRGSFWSSEPAGGAIHQCCQLLEGFGVNCSFLVSFIIHTVAVTVLVNCSYLNP